MTSSSMPQIKSSFGCTVRMLKNPTTYLWRVRRQAIIIFNTSMRRKLIKMKEGWADPKQLVMQLPTVFILTTCKKRSLRQARSLNSLLKTSRRRDLGLLRLKYLRKIWGCFSSCHPSILRRWWWPRFKRRVTTCNLRNGQPLPPSGRLKSLRPTAPYSALWTWAP